MKKKLVLGLLVSLISVLIGCLSIEGALRIYQSATKTRTTLQWHDDPIVGRRLNPSQKGLFVSDTKEYKTEVEVNKEGFRDTEHVSEKSVFRILLLGDSFVENFQVPLTDTIFKQLERKLTTDLGNPVEVIAMGLGDTGSAQQYLLLKNYGLMYKPDLVVQLFFSGNDVKNNSLTLMKDPYRPYFTLQDDRLSLQPFQMRSTNKTYRYVSFLKSHSRLIEFLLNAKGKFMSKSDGMPIDYEVYKINPSAEYQSAWNVTEKLLLATKQITEESGGKYLLVSLANNEQVNMGVQKGLIEKYPQLGSSDYDFTKPDKKLEEICSNNQIPCFFMYQTFKDFIQKNNAVTHFPLDGHLNKTGTDLAAQFLESTVMNYLVNK